MELYTPQRSPYDDTPVVVTEQEAQKHAVSAHQQYAEGQPYHRTDGYANPQEMPIAVTPGGEKRICGVTRRMLLLIIAGAVLLVGCIGAAAAAGVLASQKDKAEQKLADASAAGPSSNPSNPSNPSNATEPIGRGIVEFQVQSDWGGSTPSCPGSAGQTYTPPGTKLKFTRECNTDYPGGDITKVPMSNMQDCINLCASFYLYPQSADGRCLMVNWIYQDLQGKNQSWCFLKSAKGGGVSNTDTETAFVVDEDGKYIGNDAKYSSTIIDR